MVYLILIGLGVILTLFFGLRTLRMMPHLRGVRPAPPPMDATVIEVWMTIPHIARVTHVPEEYLWQEAGLSAPGNRRRSVEQLQADQVNQVGGDALPLLLRLQQAVDEFHRTHPPGSTAPPRQPFPNINPDMPRDPAP